MEKINLFFFLFFVIQLSGCRSEKKIEGEINYFNYYLNSSEDCEKDEKNILLHFSTGFNNDRILVYINNRKVFSGIIFSKISSGYTGRTLKITKDIQPININIVLNKRYALNFNLEKDNISDIEILFMNGRLYAEFSPCTLYFD